MRIDSFVFKFTSQRKYSSSTGEMHLYFYKETDKTNLAEIEKNPTEVDRYFNDHDLAYCYAVKLDGINVRKKI